MCFWVAVVVSPEWLFGILGKVEGVKPKVEILPLSIWGLISPMPVFVSRYVASGSGQNTMMGKNPHLLWLLQ